LAREQRQHVAPVPKLEHHSVFGIGCGRGLLDRGAGGSGSVDVDISIFVMNSYWPMRPPMLRLIRRNSALTQGVYSSTACVRFEVQTG